MSNFFHDFVLTFLPLFIVVDAAGQRSHHLSLSEGMTRKQRNDVINIGVATATVVGLIFLFFREMAA